MYKEVIEHIKSVYPGKDFIPLHEPKFLGNDRKYVMDAIDSTFVSSVGKYVDHFEEMLRDYTGAKYAVAVVNGTASLHIALLVADVKRDDLVITQPLSFIATCNAISYIGAEPIFVDVDKKTLGLSAEKLAQFLSEECELRNNECYHKKKNRRIAACVPMHTFGHPVELDKIVELCNRFKIKLIEDAAESLGSKYQGQQTGTLGLLGTYSFNGNKTITCGGGGAIVTDDEKLGKLAKHLTTQAKVPHRWEFNHDQIGYNYRLPNLNAALACAQMEMLDRFILDKRQLAKSYSEFFKTGKSGCEFVHEPNKAESNYWLNAVLLPSKKEQIEFLSQTNDNGVMTRPVWNLMTSLTMFRNCYSADISNAIDISERLVNIPSSYRGN
jgi:aminotransferase in exopolysaccharide biosynthesis